LGNENTKFFHTVTTQSYRKNIITSLKSDDGVNIYNHDQKAAIIWDSFNNRLGINQDIEKFFNLEQQIVTKHNLDHLDTPFSLKEIEVVVKYMPSDRTPGPDGLNGLYLKRC
jgi:hypothetical protein